MRSRFNCQILACAEVDDLRAQWILVNHNVVGFEVPMQDTQLFVQVLHSEQYLLHKDADLVLFVEALTKSAALALYILRETHVHHLEDDE